MRKLRIVLFALILLWFTLDLFGIPGLVTRDDWFSSAGLLELVLIALFIGLLRNWNFEPFLTLIVLSLWGILQYISHWYGLVFGASSERLARYYSMFAGLYRFFPESQTRIIPDAYHTVLGLFILMNLLVVAYEVLSARRSYHKR